MIRGCVLVCHLEKSVTIAVGLKMEGMWVYSATTGEILEQTEDPH